LQQSPVKKKKDSSTAGKKQLKNCIICYRFSNTLIINIKKPLRLLPLFWYSFLILIKIKLVFRTRVTKKRFLIGFTGFLEWFLQTLKSAGSNFESKVQQILETKEEKCN
jgi:hypothetical protein